MKYNNTVKNGIETNFDSIPIHASYKQLLIGPILIDAEEISKKIINDFHTLLNTKPIGVKFIFDEKLEINCKRPDEPIRFCQAINQVYKTSNNLLLKNEDISCLAARIALGFEDNPVALYECAKKLVETGKFKDEFSAIHILSGVPKLENKTSSILIFMNGIIPDIYVLKLNPRLFMRFIQAYQKAYSCLLRVNLTCVMPICGNCSVQPFVINDVCISFGCEDSRIFGDIDDNELVVGIPFSKARIILETLAEMNQITL